MALIIQVKDTPDKFRPMADTVVPPLLDLLRARSALEGEIHDRWEALEQAHLAATSSPTAVWRWRRSTGGGT